MNKIGESSFFNAVARKYFDPKCIMVHRFIKIITYYYGICKWQSTPNYESGENDVTSKMNRTY